MPKHTQPTQPHRNQGEGDREGDRRYRAGVGAFVQAGRVPAAATEARASVDADLDDDLGAAERFARARTATADPDDAEEVLPSFWTPRQQTAWERVRDALNRDWVQTKADLGLPGGHDLDQGVSDTLAQVVGQRRIPGGETAGVHWDIARQAMRLGHGAATFWTDEKWTEVIEARVCREWDGLVTGVEFEEVRPLILLGFQRGKKDMSMPD